MLQVIYSFNYDVILLNNESVYLLTDFCCGDNEIDRYVKEDALSDSECGKGVTYLVINKSNGRLIAYYTLSSTSILYFDEVNINGNIRGIPSIEIKMFAVSTIYQDLLYHDDEFGDNLISSIVLGSVIGDIYNISMNILGVKMIVLHSVPDAIDFYSRNFFKPMGEYKSLQDDYSKGCTPMYMPLFE